MRPSTRHVRVPDVWFGNNSELKGPKVNGVNQGGVFYIVAPKLNGDVSHEKGIFLPNAIMVGRTDPEDTTGYAVVNGWLFGESIDEIDTYRLEVGVVHNLEFAGIATNNTSARSIRIFGN